MGKRKKDKKGSSHKKSKKSKQSSSSDCSSASDEWVEEMTDSSSTVKVNSTTHQDDSRGDHEDWSNLLLSGITRKELRQSKEKNKDENDKRYMLDNLGQTERELNPYWKDGGSGLPHENPVTAGSLRQATVTVGDQGVTWLRRALQRAKEQAAEQRRPLHDVVAERWGSLEKLESMIAAAEERENKIGSSRISFRGESSKNDRERFNKQYDHDMNSSRREKSKNFSSDDKSRTNRSCESDKRDLSKSQQEFSKKGKYFSKPRESSDDSSSGELQRNNNKKSEKRSSQTFQKKIASSSSSSSDDERSYHRKNDSLGHERNSKKSSKHNSSKPFRRPRSRNSSGSDSSSEDNKRSYNRKNDSLEHGRNSKKSSKHNASKPFRRPRSRSDSDNSSEDDKRSYHRKNDSLEHEQNSKKSSKEHNAGKPFRRPRSRSSSGSDSSSEDDERADRKGGNRKHEHNRSKESRRDSNPKYYRERNRQGWRKTSEKPPDKVDKQLESEEEEVKERVNPPAVEEVLLTDKEMNELGAKLVKAELLGNEDLVKELKARLERARESKLRRGGEGGVGAKEEVVILTHTDAKGFTRPVSLGAPEPSGGRRRAKKIDTHSGGQRVRYFADDDKYNLKEMFQREKLSTVEDSNEVFAKLASKGEVDDAFEETACMKESDGKQQARKRQQAISESKRVARSLDNCHWCLESKQMLKHLIVAIGKQCYLCVPPYQSLTENHCLIVPSHHSACATQLDEDVWAEVQEFRKCLVQMFLSRDEDVVFFESARHLSRFPHMVLNCVPVPKETGDMAPLYFKKAIQECEMEWSNNKKLVDLRGRDVRRAVPKGLPYFSVDFGVDSGYAHVIENEQLFPENFAQEIIGGMLDLDHTIWRKQRRQTFEEQSKRVIAMTKLWDPYDFTKKK